MRSASFAAAALAFAAAACGADDESADYGEPESAGRASGGSSGAPTSTSTSPPPPDPGVGGAVPEPPLPEEQEDRGSFRAPVVTSGHIWSANPETGLVAVIDVADLSVETVAVGWAPDVLAAVPGEVERAVLIDGATSDGWLLSIDEDGAVQAAQFALHPGANRWAVDPSGSFAVAWTRADDSDSLDGAQDLSLVALADASVVRLTAGYRPEQVHFDADDARVLVVAERGISTFALDGGAQLDFVSLDDGELLGTDVSIVPDGSWALLRDQASATVVALSLVDSRRLSVDLGEPVTDLDLSDDGRVAVAVLREAGELVRLEVPASFESGNVERFPVSAHLVGSASLSGAGELGWAYTTAVPSSLLTATSFDADEQWTADVYAAVTDVRVAPDGAFAVALMGTLPVQPDPATLAGLDPAPQVPGFALLPSRSDRTWRVVSVDGAVEQVVFDDVAADPRALVTTTGTEGESWAAFVVRSPSLRVDRVGLPGRPLAAGIVPGADLGFVAQQHPEGRITFIDLATAEARTLTGYELRARTGD